MEKDLGKKTKSMKVDGGASVNNILMQFQADITGKRIIRPRVLETTALGAGMLAGLGCGIFSSLKDLSKVWAFEREFRPEMTKREREKRLALWKEVVKKA
jgi:glycerol kinase